LNKTIKKKKSKEIKETDEKKTVSELVRNGKIIKRKNSSKEAFITVKDVPIGCIEFTESGESPVYKVYLKDIEQVNCYVYYQDLTLINPITMKRNYVVKHKGRRTFDKLTVKQVKYLIKKGIINKEDIMYFHIDFSTKMFVESKNNKTPPKPESVTKKYKECLEDYKTQHGTYPKKINRTIKGVPKKNTDSKEIKSVKEEELKQEKIKEIIND
jgi:hypothetical protein